MDFKGYYSVIPATVRYDSNLTPNAKLLYAEITSLCNEYGYCWATNDYFSKLYNVSTTSISKWISSLVQNGYITTEIEYKEGSKQILKRYIRIIKNPIEEKLNTPLTKVKYPIEEKLKENNKNIILKKNIYIVEIIDYLNEKAGTRYKPSSKKTKDLVNARLNEGFEVQDFKKVIDNKVNDWKGTEWEKFLRPETLFSSKFEGYLNQNIIKTKKEPVYRFEEEYEMFPEDQIEKMMMED